MKEPESKDYRPPVEYTFEEFQDHLSAQLIVRNYEYVTREGRQVELNEIVPSDSIEASVLKQWDYFMQIYPREIALEKGSCFMSICSHLAKCMNLYDDAGLAVLGSESGALLSDPLLRAVHFYFTTRLLSSMPDDESAAKDIVDLARTQFKEEGT